MTAEEWVNKLFAHGWPARDDVGEALEAYADAARREERERCAEVADKIYENEHNALPDDRSDGRVVAEYIAATIRALPDEEAT